jgi:hypothetical protein
MQQQRLEELEYALKISYEHPWHKTNRMFEKKNQVQISLHGKQSNKLSMKDLKIAFYNQRKPVQPTASKAADIFQIHESP